MQKSHIRNMVTGWYYPGKRYDELTDEEKANKDMVNYINNYYTSQFFSYYSKIEYGSLDTEAKAAADVLILQAISKDFGVTFNNYDEYTIYIRNMVTSWYYPGKRYDELTDEEKANIYLQNNIDNYCNNNYFSQYYTEAVYNALSSNEKKALADKYLMENCVKPDYVSNHSEDAYTALTDIEKAALLKAYKDSWLDNLFSEYN